MTARTHPRRAGTAVLAMLLAAGTVGGTAAAAPVTAPPAATAAAFSSTVATLLSQMTLDEKIGMVHGGAEDPEAVGAAGYLPGVPRLGIPELRLADGPAGVRVAEAATALPAPAALASSFDDTLARQFGEVIGRDGRALGVDVLLSPMTNNIRVPTAGRNFETFGEDPLLASRTVGAEVAGIQSQGLIATIKHYAANNQEQNRMDVDVRVDEQTLQEIELPAFQAAVDAGAGSVMCAYNQLGGVHACENEDLLTTILREQWGFEGWVMSDWGATQSTEAITAGLDMEMPRGTYFGEPLREAILAGEIPEAALDTSVGRILTQMERVGLLAADPAPRPERDPAGAAQVAQQVAEAGAVLLKNDRNALPLASGADADIAVIGPTAKTPVVTGGGSSRVLPESAAAPIDAITARAGTGADVGWSVGEDLEGVLIPAEALSTAPLQRTGEDAVPAGEALDYAATVTAPEDGTYTLSLQTTGAGARVSVDGEEVLSTRSQFGAAGGSLIATADGWTNDTHYVELEAGTTHELTVTGEAGDESLQARLHWVTPSARERTVQEAADAARSAETAVVFAYDEGTEGVDRSSLSLPGTQDELIAAVAAANPNTVVVLNTGAAVTMPWVSSVRAVLETWYPGQEGAEATARLLFGDVSPSGKLSQTFPVSEDVTPVAGDLLRYPGVDGQQVYSEGIDVGYRWYDAVGAESLFPFGHGLSYTSFEYGDLRVQDREGRIEVAFTVTNAGERAGAEVPQVYVGPSSELTQDQAVKSLVGYEKVALAPGQSRRLSIVVEDRWLSSWAIDDDTWELGTGPRDLWVGTSSADLALHDTVDVRR
ncbi:glycoside hydrolase family 3 C-terminal domain-containing protein [Kineococcus arenarius]|uniref:glycoside hydrolase family 3 C-terminal domain-containing protein n=1 Tax=unclassified Kineococcus TaxID=2621656 RepID=UPI003D7DF059